MQEGEVKPHHSSTPFFKDYYLEEDREGYSSSSSDQELASKYHEEEQQRIPLPTRRRCGTPVAGWSNREEEENAIPFPTQDEPWWPGTQASKLNAWTKPSPPLPMNFVEFTTIPDQEQAFPTAATVPKTSSSTKSPSQESVPFTPQAAVSSPPFRLLPRSKTTLDMLCSVGISTSGTSPARLRKRAAWNMDNGGMSISEPASPNTTALKQNLHRLSIHSPTCSSDGTTTTVYEGLRTSTPSSSYAKRSSTPLTIEGSPSSGFSRVISTPRQHWNASPLAHGGFPRESDSPKIVPLTVLTHDNGSTEGVKLPPRRQRLFPPRTPPEVRSIWSSDGSFQQTTPDSVSSGMRLPKISLTPRRSPRRSIPKFPIPENGDGDTPASKPTPGGGVIEQQQHVTVQSFLRTTPRVTGESIFGPPTPTEIRHALEQCQPPPETVGCPDEESLSEGSGDEVDEFLLAFPSTLAEEKLQRHSIKMRKTDAIMMGGKTRSMTSMASSSCASLRGIAFAPSDTSLYEMAPGSMDLSSEHHTDESHHHIGWVFDDTDDHVPPQSALRDSMVTPPILPTNDHHTTLPRTTRLSPSP